MKMYQMGKMGVSEGIALVFVLAITRLFLSGLSEVVRENGQILWLSMIIYSTIPLGVLYMMIYVRENTSGDIFMVCQQLVGTIGAWVILVGYIIMFLGTSASLLRQYAEYTLITALPLLNFQIVIIWYAVTAGILCYLGIEAICRSGYVMLPFIMLGVLLIFILVSPFYVPYNLTPWQGNGIMKAVRAGFVSVGFTLSVLSLVFFSSAFQDVKTIKKIALYSLGGTLVLRVLYMLVYTMVFGVGAGAEKAMPFFELTRLVYINQYFQRIEALFIVVWVIIGLLSVAGSLYIGLYLIVALLRLPALKTIVPLGVVIIANIAMLPPDISYTIEMDKLLVRISQIGIYVFPGILFAMIFIRKRRKKACTSG